MLGLIIFLGSFAGILSAFFGVGGGILIVPGLYVLFPNLSPQVVITCSLGLIFFNSSINLYNFTKMNLKPSSAIVITVGVATIVGALLGAMIVSYVAPQIIKNLFAVFAILIVIKLIRDSKKPTPGDNTPPAYSRAKVPAYFLTGFLGGLLSGLTGLGGGAVMIPLFISMLKINLRFIPVYSNGAMIFATGSGLFLHLFQKDSDISSLPEIFHRFQVGHLNILITFLLLIGAFSCSKFGAKLSIKVAHEKKRIAFIILLLTISSKIILGNFMN